MGKIIKYAENKSSAFLTGTPIRKSILNAKSEEGFDETGFNKNDPIILVVGGSQGSVSLNTTVADGICLLKKYVPNIQVIHITGKNDSENVGKKYRDLNIKNVVNSFSNNLGELYKITDVAVTRAGALTVSELSALGLPAILIPFPYATDDHQKENAKMMAEAGCAKISCESELSAEIICEELKLFIKNDELRTNMANAALEIAKPNADNLLCDYIEKNEK